MIEEYCKIDYRGYLLEIQQHLPTGITFYTGNCSGVSTYEGRYVVGCYTEVNKLLSDYFKCIDEKLGEREKEEEILFCTIIYKSYELKVWLKEDLHYMAWIDGFDFASWGENWNNEKLVSVIEAFRKKVDSGTGEDVIQSITNYKGHRLVVRKYKNNSKYIGTSTFLNDKWRHEDYSVDFIVKRHQIEIDRIVEQQKKMVGTTYEEVYHEWGNNCKKITYKNRVMWVTALKRAKDKRVFYIGTFCDLKFNSLSIESIHYDKVISKFEKFVDEYCTEWVVSSSTQYKGYNLVSKRDRNDCSRFFSICEIHKNSTFKCISNSIKEIEEKFKVRIDRMIEEKEKVQRKMLTPKQEKIQELEQLLARTSTQLEELKKEKDTLTYKGIVLEYGVEGDWLVGKIRNAPKGTKELEANHEERIKVEFEKYIDELEKSHHIYNMIRPEIKNRY